MQSATSRYDLAPRPTLPRLAAGAIAGLVGGLAFGVLMILPAITGGGLEETGMMTQVALLTGTTSLPLLWGLHVLASALFGLLFALVVAPRGWRHALPRALLWAGLLWLVGAFLLLRVLTGQPLALTGAVLYNLLGHLAYGAVLGVTYPAILREEMGALRDHDRDRARTRRPLAKP